MLCLTSKFGGGDIAPAAQPVLEEAEIGHQALQGVRFVLLGVVHSGKEVDQMERSNISDTRSCGASKSLVGPELTQKPIVWPNFFFPRVRTPCGHGAQVIVEERKSQSDGGENNKDHNKNQQTTNKGPQDESPPSCSLSSVLGETGETRKNV